METLTIEQITDLQKQYGLTEMQDRINSGHAWHLEGSYGRQAMSMLEDGACMLPDVRKTDAYGSTVPARSDLKAGTQGTLENSQAFWTKVINGEIIDMVTCDDEGEEQ